MKEVVFEQAPNGYVGTSGEPPLQGEEGNGKRERRYYQARTTRETKACIILKQTADIISPIKSSIHICNR